MAGKPALLLPPPNFIKDTALALDFETLPRDVMRSIGFLTRLPVPSKWFEGDDGSLSTTCRAFPLAGAIAALPATAMMAIGTVLDLPVLLTATIATLVATITTGALHEDGLADVADGFFGGNQKERRLEIMKDSRIGVYGGLALLFAVIVKTIVLAALLQQSLYMGCAVLIASGGLSRAALVWHWSDLEPARPDGVAYKAGTPTEDACVFALASGLGLALLFAWSARGLTTSIIGFGVAFVVSFAFRRLCAKTIGGYTGDTLGASAVLAELAFLTGLASGW